MFASRPSGPFLRVTFANFFFFLNFASFFLLPLYVKSLGGTEATVGAVMGTAQAASLLSLPLIGPAIDRFGRRRFFVAGTIGTSVAALGFLGVDRIAPPLFALRVLQGVCFAASFTAATTLAAELAPIDRRARALGIFGVSTLLTHAIAPAVGEEIVRRGGFSALFVAASFCSLVPLFLLPGVPRRPPIERSQLARRWHIERLHWVLLGTTILSGIGFGAVNTFVPTFVSGSALGRVGFFYGAYSLTAVLTRFVGSGASDRLGRIRVVLPALCALAMSIAALALVHNVSALVCVGLLFGAAQGITYPTLHAYLVDVTPSEFLGRSQALFNGAFNLGILSSAMGFGPIADALGQRPMFLIASITPLAAAALLYGFSEATPGTAHHV